jgi:hypothetical protein
MSIGSVGSLVDVAATIAADFVERGVPATVYFGPEYKAQDDAGVRVVIVPTRDKYSLVNHMGGDNPRPLRTREYGFIAQIWSKATTQADPRDQPAAEWAASDLLVNAFIVSMMHVGANCWMIGEGVHNTKTPHAQFGRQYDLQVWWYCPIVEVPWETVTDGKLGGHTFLVFPDGPQPVS